MFCRTSYTEHEITELWQCSDLMCPVDLAQAASHPEPERCYCPAAELRLTAGWQCSLSVAPCAVCSCCADSYIAGMTTHRVQVGHLENKNRDDRKTKIHQHLFCGTHRWHKLLDDLVELFCVGRNVGAATDIQSKLTQRKNISSGIPTWDNCSISNQALKAFYIKFWQYKLAWLMCNHIYRFETST